MFITKTVLAAALALTFSLSAQATLIDFEDIGNQLESGYLTDPIDGFVFNKTMYVINQDFYHAHFAYAGASIATNVDGGMGTLARVKGGTFSFESMWIQSDSHPGNVTLVGFLNGQRVNSLSISDSDGQPSVNGFLKATANFAEIDYLEIIPSGKFFFIDNITVTSISAVPEPETYAMMLSGLGLVGFVARRRSKFAV